MAKKPAPSAFSGLRWEDDLLEFELNNAGSQIPGSISREALEDAGAGRRAVRWVLEDTFHRVQARLIPIVLSKHRAAKPGSRAAIHVSSDDLNRDAAPVRMARA